MKIATLTLLASLGIFGVGGAVYAVTPSGGFTASSKTKSKSKTPAALAAESSDKGDDAVNGQGQVPTILSQFSAGSTIKVDGRLGHATLPASSPSDTFVMLELQGGEAAQAAAPTVSLSLVIDKSGSMQGSKHQNALGAAVTAVQRLKDGDRASVVAFDTKTEIVVPLTTINASSKESIVRAIRGIQLGGDTCISCGIDEGLRQLRSAGQPSSATVERMLLLSDGEPTAGVRDVQGFGSIASRALGQGIAITTVGVDVSYNEKVMTAIAVGSNGRHYFVENDRDLVKVFEAEAQTLAQTVATNAVAELDLAPGVELVQVFDRTFTRSGSRVTVPIGSLAKGELRTVLVKVRVPSSQPGQLKLADVRLGFRDVTSGKDVSEQGKLSVEVGGPASEIDAVVLDRVQRSETAAALVEANSLFSSGKTNEAQQRLAAAQQQLRANRSKADKTAPSPRKAGIDRSFEAQEKELNRSSGGFATPPAAAPGAPRPAPAETDRKQKATTRENAAKSSDMGL